MRHPYTIDEWRPTSQSAIFDIPLREYTLEERGIFFDQLGSRPQSDWASALMPAEYLVKTNSAPPFGTETPAGAPCPDWVNYAARIKITLNGYLNGKDWDYSGSPWKGLSAYWIAKALVWHAIDEALEIATSDEGIDWEWFDREMVATLTGYLADLQAIPDHDGEVYEDRGEY